MGVAKSMSLEFQQPDSICVVEYMGERLYFGAEQVIDEYVDSSDLYRWIKML